MDWQSMARSARPQERQSRALPDRDARLYRKGKGKEAKLCYAGHVMMENRNGLAVDGQISKATGTAEQSFARSGSRVVQEGQRQRGKALLCRPRDDGESEWTGSRWPDQQGHRHGRAELCQIGIPGCTGRAKAKRQSSAMPAT